MKKNVVLVLSIVVCFISLLAFPILSQADNDFSASVNAMQQQGFIRQDAGGPLGTDEMALDPFRAADQLNYGGLFGPLADGYPGGFYYLPDQVAPPPDARDMGFGSGNDQFIPINQVHVHSD